MVSVLDFRSEGQWFVTQSLPLCCFHRQETLPHIVSLHPGVTQAPVVQKLDSAIHRINHYPVDNAIGFPNTYPLDSDLSGG